MKGNFAFPLSLVGFLVCVLSVGFISSVISTSAHAQAAVLQNIIVNNPSHTGTSMFATFHKAAEDAGWANFRGDEGWSSQDLARAGNHLVTEGLVDAETGYSTDKAHASPITAGFYNAGDTIQIQFVFDVDVFVHKDLRLQLHFDGASRWFSLNLDSLTGIAAGTFSDSHYTVQADNTYYQTTAGGATLTFEYEVSSADNDNDFNGINTALDRHGFFAIAEEDLTQGAGWSTEAGPNQIKSEREAAITSANLITDDPLPWGGNNRWKDHPTTRFYSTEARYGAGYFYVYAPSVSNGVNTYSHGVDTIRASTFVYKFPSTETIETGDFEIEIKFSNSGAGAGGTSTIAETTRDDSFTAEDFVFTDSEGMELDGWTVSDLMFHALDMKQPDESNEVRRRSAAFKVYRATITPPLNFDGDVEITVPENATVDIAGNMSQASEALTVSVNTVRDAALLAGIREELNIPAGTTVTQANLLELTSLDLSGSDVSDLTFLQSATNLKELDLSDTQVSDISALSSLTNLEELDLSGTPVEDITPLSDLTNLKVLDLSDTEVSDISALSSTN